MIIAVPKEKKDLRCALVPESVKKLVAQEGVEVLIEKSCTALFTDDEYKKAGAKIESDRKKLYSQADVILRVESPVEEDVHKMKKEALHISFLDPFNERALIESFIKEGKAAISMEMIPRITIAQKMDALSSQASLAGYVAIVLAAERLNQIFPMMMTPAGTISPTRVFIIGAGVAGLQAIATAKRMGARVEAFDTRPVVEEQVQSLGAKFIKVDLGETGQTKQGYAKALTSEQLAKQQTVMAQRCAQADVVVTTAKLFGRPAPRVITNEIIKKMKHGSIIVDLAVGTGGNVEGSQVDQEVEIDGVRIIGINNLEERVAKHASQMYSSNLTNLILHMWDTEKKQIDLAKDDEVLKGCLITHKGELVNTVIKSKYEEK